MEELNPNADINLGAAKLILLSHFLGADLWVQKICWQKICLESNRLLNNFPAKEKDRAGKSWINTIVLEQCNTNDGSFKCIILW